MSRQATEGCGLGLAPEHSGVVGSQGPAVPCDAPSAMPRAWLDGSSRSKALSSQGPRAFSFSRAATRVIPKLFASSGAKASRVGNSVLPLGRRVFPFFLEGGPRVYSNARQCVSTDWRSARRPIRGAAFDRADACHLRATSRAEATRRSRRSDAFDWPRFRRYALNGRSS